MLSATPSGKPAIIKQKLPTEIIGIICEFSDFETHTAISSTCLSVRLYVPLRKVVGFEQYKKLITLYMIIRKEAEKTRVFQERIHLDLHHEALTQDQLEYLNHYGMIYELCRIAREVLCRPKAYKGIDLLFQNCYFLTAAARVGDLELLILLLQVPRMNTTACLKRAFSGAASMGQLEIVQFLLQDPKVDPLSCSNDAIRGASQNGHLAVVKELLQDPRVDPSARVNSALSYAAENGHLFVFKALLQDPRRDLSDHYNIAIIYASQNGHLAVVQELLQDPRIDPSSWGNNAIRLASKNGHAAVVHALLLDPRVDPSDSDNRALKSSLQNGHEDVVQALLKDPRVTATKSGIICGSSDKRGIRCCEGLNAIVDPLSRHNYWNGLSKWIATCFAGIVRVKLSR